MGMVETFRELSGMLLTADEASDMVVDATEECVYKQRLSRNLFSKIPLDSGFSNLMLLLCVKYLYRVVARRFNRIL
jgi:hypothetical protein